MFGYSLFKIRVRPNVAFVKFWRLCGFHVRLGDTAWLHVPPDKCQIAARDLSPTGHLQDLTGYPASSELVCLGLVHCLATGAMHILKQSLAIAQRQCEYIA